MLKLLVALISCLTFSVSFGTVSRAQQAAVRAIIEPTERPGLELWLDKDCYEAGESLVIHFKSERDGYLSLWSIDPVGRVSILLPNPFYPDNFVRGGVSYSFPAPNDPFQIKVAPPPTASAADREIIWGVVTGRRLSLPVPGSKGVLDWVRTVQVRLQNLSNEDVWWASKKVEFRYGPCEGGPPVEEGGKRALLVGIDDYIHGKRLDLHGSVNGTRLMQKALQELGYETQLLVDHAATKANIQEAIQDFLGGVGPTGTALFFYSGHGAFVKDENGDESDGNDEALVPADCNRLEGEPLILDDELAEWLGGLNAGRVLFVSSSCHSGTLLDIEKGPISASEFRPLLASRSSFVILQDGVLRDLLVEARAVQKEMAGIETCGPMEVGWEVAYPCPIDPFDLLDVLPDARVYPGYSRPMCSVLARWVWEGLAQLGADRNGDQMVSAAELYEFVYPQIVKTSQYCAQRRKDICEELAKKGISCVSHPVLESSGDAEKIHF